MVSQQQRQNYYGKELKDLTLPEVAMLAGLPKAPNNYDPTKKKMFKSNRKKKCCSKLNESTWIYNKTGNGRSNKVDVEKGLKPALNYKQCHTLHLWMQL